MYQQLKEKLWAYIVHNNPDMMFQLQDEYRVVPYLEDKVSAVMPTVLKLLEQGLEGHAIQELCLNELTADLKPSRYQYISHILSEEFETDYGRLRENGLLIYETVNLVAYCQECFDALHFSAINEEGSTIYYAITGKIAAYLEEQRKDR